MPQVWVDAIAAFVAEYVAEKIGGAEVAKAQHSNLEHESSKILDLPASPLIREGEDQCRLNFQVARQAAPCPAAVMVSSAVPSTATRSSFGVRGRAARGAAQNSTAIIGAGSDPLRLAGLGLSRSATERHHVVIWSWWIDRMISSIWLNGIEAAADSVEFTVGEFGLGQFALARCSGVDCGVLAHDLLHS